MLAQREGSTKMQQSSMQICQRRRSARRPDALTGRGPDQTPSSVNRQYLEHPCRAGNATNRSANTEAMKLTITGAGHIIAGFEIIRPDEVFDGSEEEVGPARASRLSEPRMYGDGKPSQTSTQPAAPATAAAATGTTSRTPTPRQRGGLLLPGRPDCRLQLREARFAALGHHSGRDSFRAGRSGDPAPLNHLTTGN